MCWVAGGLSVYSAEGRWVRQRHAPSPGDHPVICLSAACCYATWHVYRSGLLPLPYVTRRHCCSCCWWCLLLLVLQKLPRAFLQQVTEQHRQEAEALAACCQALGPSA